MSKLKILDTVLLAVIAACMIAILVVLVLWPKGATSNQSDSIDGSETVEMMKIKTPYCTLNYPAKWKELVKYKESTEGETYTGTFYCQMKDQELELFNVHFGAPDTGTLIGSILKDGKTIPFSVASSSFEPGEGWTEDERMLYFAMANGINDVIESVTGDPNYLG